MNALFENTVKLRGFLTRDAELPPSDRINEHSLAALSLASVSGVWDLGSNEWHPRIDLHRIICPGPYFCGFVRGMRRGDYLEIEGELRTHPQMRTVVVGGESTQVPFGSSGVYAVRITRLDRPDALVDYGEDG
jgi:hypothetical protein